MEPITYRNYYENLPNGWCLVKLKNVCKSITAGGDKPKNTTKDKTRTNIYPVIANGLQNDGIIGFSDEYTISEECLTLSGRGTIGFPVKRNYCFTPVVRLLVIKPLLKYIDLDYLSYLLSEKCGNGVGTSIQQLTVPMVIDIPIQLAPLNEQIKISKKVSRIFNTIISY